MMKKKPYIAIILLPMLLKGCSAEETVDNQVRIAIEVNAGMNSTSRSNFEGNACGEGDKCKL